MKGLGFDLGVEFPQVSLHDIPKKKKPRSDEKDHTPVITKDPNVACSFSKHGTIMVSGICGSFGECKFENSYYFGVSCLDKKVGELCEVRTNEVTHFTGICSSG